MIACSSMLMNRTDRPGWCSSGIPVWCRPTTPWFCSPARMSRIELVLWLVTGILLHGKIGMPRQAGTEWLPTGTDAGYTPLLVHSRPNAAIVLGFARHRDGAV